MEDVGDLKSLTERYAGSSPASHTIMSDLLFVLCKSDRGHDVCPRSPMDKATAF